MITAKATLALLLAYMLALAAGTTSGLLADRLHGESTISAKPPPLAEELQLSPQQTAQMRLIWEQTSRDLDSYFRQAQTIQRDRDQALVSLLTDDQKEKFAIMDKDFAQRFDDLKSQRDAMFKDAVLKTESILSDDQRAKYESLVKARIGHDPLQQAEPATEPSINVQRP